MSFHHRPITTTRKDVPNGSLRTVCRGQRVQVSAEEQLAERLRQRRRRHLQGAEEVRVLGAQHPRADRDATKRKVMAALKAMVGRARPGDHLVFTFSSHGTQVPSQAGSVDEDDALDEAFASYDLKQ